MSTGYMWNGSAWRQLSSGWMWNGSQWRQITSGWMWNGSSWRQIFSSGTFQPEIRDVSGNVISTRAVNNLLYGYRGSNTSATYSYTWQYGRGEDYESNWTTQTGPGATGTLTGSTLTTTYQTSTTDVTRLESALNNYLLYMRFRVTRSGETQDSNVVRIHKRVASQTTQFSTGYRAFDSFTTTYNWSVRNPYSGDRLVFWSSSDWSNTSEITNDRRPDYYIFTYTIDGEITVKDSRDEDPSDPRTPTNASRFQVPFSSSYLGKPVFYEIEAHTSSPSSPTIVSGQTRNVSDGTLQAPTNLNIQYNYFLYPNKLYMTWDPSDGGNNNTITYTWRLYIDGSFFTSGNVTGGIGTGLFATYPSSGALAFPGTFTFEVRAAQSGQTTVTSELSNAVTLDLPSAFTYSLTNRTTTDGAPGDFTISAFAQNPSIINRVEIDWSDSTNASEYISAWSRPDGTSSSNPVTTSSDYWGYAESGTYTSTITARNTRIQYLRISWTKPAGTSALSYRVTYTRRIESAFVTTTVDVGDVTFYDFTYANDASGAPTASVVSVVAYSTDTAGEGLSRTGTSSGSSSLTSGSLQQVATRQKSRTEFLTYVVPSVGTITITGEAEPNEILGFNYTGTWTPSLGDPGWSISRTWGITRDATNQPPSYTRGTGNTVTPLVGDVGEFMLLRVVAAYKSAPSVTVTGSSERIVPGQPAFQVANNGNSTFTVSSVDSAGAGFYYGSYTGGLISERTISSSFTSPTISEGNKTVTIFGRAKKVFDGVQELIDGRRSRSSTVNVTDLGAFIYQIADTTATPSTPNAFTLNWDSGTTTPVRYDWNDTSNTTVWYSSISGGPEGARNNERGTSDDFWATTAGNSYTVQVYGINRQGKVTATWGQSSGANSYRINYTVGSSTLTLLIVGGSVTSQEFFLQTGQTFTINSVTSYSTTDGTGGGRTGSRSGVSSITPSQKLGTSRFVSGTAPTLPIPAVPTPFWNYNGVSGSTYLFGGGWNSVANATSYDYQIQYATSSAGANTNTVSGSQAGTTLSGSSTKAWSRMRVRAVGPGGTSSYSAYTAWV